MKGGRERERERRKGGREKGREGRRHKGRERGNESGILGKKNKAPIQLNVTHTQIDPQDNTHSEERFEGIQGRPFQTVAWGWV